MQLDPQYWEEPERVKGVALIDRDEGYPTVFVERICSVGGRMYYKIGTDRGTLEFYVTRKGLIRVVQ